MSGTHLPDGFAVLEPFVAEWALATEHDRYSKRCASSPDAMRIFYDAFLPLVPRVLDELDRYTPEAFPDELLPLLRLTYSYLCIAMAVEGWGQGRIPDTGASQVVCLDAPVP